jgi:hypothetical protein
MNRATLGTMRFWPVDEPWQYRVLDALPAGVDRAQLERNLQLSPTERIEAMMTLVATAEALRAALKGQR